MSIRRQTLCDAQQARVALQKETESRVQVCMESALGNRAVHVSHLSSPSLAGPVGGAVGGAYLQKT